jgi:histidine triad (HIT) family protein
MQDCIFCKIIRGEIPSTPVYSDDECIVIRDIAPQAPTHLLMIPREHYATVKELDENRAAVLGRCMKKIGELAVELGLDGGFRIIMNQGDDACQTVKHLHVHILAGKKLSEKMV